MSDLLHDAYQRALRYQETLEDRPVFPNAEMLEHLKEFDEDLPTESQAAGSTLELLEQAGSPATVACTGGRYFGFVTGGALPITIATNWLTTAWDQNGAFFATSPVVAKIEEVVLGWLVELFGLPAGSAGAFVTGATMANFTGLAAARHALLARQGWDVETKGLFGAPEIKVVVGEEVHVSVLKALSLVGFGRERVIRVPVDAQGRMIAGELPPLDDQTIVCAQAGNVNSGAFDPLRELGQQTNAAGAWLHIDGAFGMWALASPQFATLMDGVELADSWSLDAHKWLNVPYDSGIALCKHPEHLQAAMTATAAYLTPSPYREPANFTPEFSRRGRTVDVWAALRTLGRQGLASLIERHCHFAQTFAAQLSQAGYTVHNEVVLNQVVVSFGEAATTERVIEAIQQEGTFWAGKTTWQGHTAMRISVSGWATTEHDVQRSLNALLKIAQTISG